MSSLSRRIAAIERRVRQGAPAEDLFDARRAWPVRFARHSPANAELLDRIQVWRHLHFPRTYVPPDERLDIWDVVGDMGLEAGSGVYDGQVGLPPAPTAEERAAIGLLEELCSVANQYELATGDRFPLPGWV